MPGEFGQWLLEAPVAYLQTDARGCVVAASRAWVDLTGHSAASVTGLNLATLLAGDAVAVMDRLWNDLGREGSVRGRELCWRGGDGREVMTSIEARGVRSPDGVLERVHLVVQAVGSAAILASALRDREEQFYRALARIPFPAIVHAEDGEVILVNEAWTRLTGYTSEELPTVEAWLQRAYGPEKAATVASSIARLYTLTEEESEGEYRIRTRWGEERIWEFGSAPFGTRPDGRRVVVSMASDVTERRRAEEALRLSEANLERAQAVGRIGNWISSPGQPRGLEWSRECCRIFGVPPEEFEPDAETFWKRVHPEDRPAVQAARDAALRGEGSYDLEHRIVLPDGVVRWVREQAEVERDASGRVRRMIGVVQDITERRQLEEQWRHVQKLEAVGQLAGGVAHDFNNILAAMMLLIDQVRERAEPGWDLADSVEELQRCAQRAADLTRQLLMFARRSSPRKQPVRLNQLLADLERWVRRLIGDDIALELDLAADLPLVEADPTMLQQAVVNLCVNAREAMTSGGRLRLQTCRYRFGPSDLPARPGRKSGEFVGLSVEDTGCGMDEATRARLFEPFFTTKGVGRGSGLGLSTVHGIVAQHQGWMEVETAPGRGSTFRLFLPAQTVAGVVPPSASRAGGARGETILVVEDEAPVRAAVVRFLRRCGYRVIEAASPREALQMWETADRVDLLFTDVVMPGGVSGVALARQLRGLRPELPVVITSGYSGDGVDIPRLDGEGMVFLPKPCPPQELATVIRRCLETRAPVR